MVLALGGSAAIPSLAAEQAEFDADLLADRPGQVVLSPAELEREEELLSLGLPSRLAG
jgi:hypothetical protein